MSLTEWIDGYRQLDPDDVARPQVDVVDDWEEQDLIAADDRVADRRPRWMERARAVGYGPPGWR